MAVLRTLRVRQWVKNLFVLAALVFSKHLLDLPYLLPVLGAFAVFCGLSGAVYAFNDLLDIESDRKHPRKKFRPIAAGALSKRQALVLSAVLASTALASAFLIAPGLAVVAAAYLANNLAYTVYLKRIAFLDVLMIGVGFLLRVLAGGYAIDVPVSLWLLLCTALLACFLGFGKRAHELCQAQDDHRNAGETRASLRGYSLVTLRVVLMTLAIGTCAVYALYTRDSRTTEFFHTKDLIWTLPFCILGIVRFLQLALWKHVDESPTDAILRDWPFLSNLAAWGITVVVIIYG